MGHEHKRDEDVGILTERLRASIYAVMRSEVEVECALRRTPGFLTWGRATFHHTSTFGDVKYEYGGDETLPDDGFGAFGIIVVPLN